MNAISSVVCDPSKVIYDHVRGEYICIETGEVLSEHLVDEGPEWREFGFEDRLSRARTGSPYTNKIHDGGISTDIGASYRNKLRKIHHIVRTKGSNVIINALKLMNEITSKLYLPNSVKESAGIIIRKLHERRLLKNKRVPEIVAVATISAAKSSKIPIDINTVLKLAGITREAYWKTLMLINKKAGDVFKMGIAEPSIYVPKISRNLNLPSNVESLAIMLLKKLKRIGVLDGKGPAGIAAAAVYVAGILLNSKRTQKEIADSVGITEVTVRNRYKDVVERLNIEILM